MNYLLYSDRLVNGHDTCFKIYLRNKETQQTKNIFFACLNDGLVKSLLKISY